MSDVLEYDIITKLETLVDKATNQRQQVLDTDFVAQIKAICKRSDKYALAAFDLIYDRLRQPHSQVRLLSLELCNELFARSKAFRGLVATKFTTFLQLIVGFQSDNPLPPPINSATALRAKALEYVESWNSTYGTTLRQIGFGYNYLKNTLRFQFPEVDRRRQAEAAAQAERDARAARIAQEKYSKLIEDWPYQYAELELLQKQVEEVFELLHTLEHPQHNGEQDELGWEDVEAAGVDNLPGDVEGLNTYATGDNVASTSAPTHPLFSNSLEENEALLETLQGLYKLICNQALPALRQVLQTVVRIDHSQFAASEHAQRERLLRTATDLRIKFTQAKDEYEASQLQLKHMVQTQKRRIEHKAKAKAVMEDVFGPDSDEDDDGKRQASKQRGQPAGLQGEEPAEPNPYHTILDPTAPKQKQHQISQHKAKFANNLVAKLARSSSKTEHTTPATKGQSNLPEDLKKQLLSQAPVLPSGAYQHVWDSDATAPRYVSSHGLEVANHWGPVDVHQEMPAERIEELFLVQLPYKQQQAVDASTTSAQQQRQRQRQQQSQQSEPTAGGSGIALQLPSTIPGGDSRVQRVADRAYNDAIISGIASDEQLARVIQQAEAPGGDGATQAAGNKNKKSAAKRKAPAKERLAKKLLSSKALEVAAAGSDAAEQYATRERYSNRWENK